MKQIIHDKEKPKKRNEIKASCNTCRRIYYNPNDRRELQRCEVVGSCKNYPLNPEALEALAKSKELPGFCEHYFPGDSFLDRKIVY